MRTLKIIRTLPMHFSRKTIALLALLPIAAIFVAHDDSAGQTLAPVPAPESLSAFRPTPVAAIAVLARARVRADRIQASGPVVGGVPTVVVARDAWGVQEQGPHACRVALGYVHHGVVVRLEVTTYVTRDCAAIIDAEAHAVQALP